MMWTLTTSMVRSEGRIVTRSSHGSLRYAWLVVKLTHQPGDMHSITKERG